MNNKIFELVYDSRAYDESEIDDLAEVLRKVGIEVEVYTSLRKSINLPSLIIISLAFGAFTAFFEGFFAEAGKDTWILFKEKIIKTLLQTKKKDIPQLEIRVKENGLEISTAYKSNNEREILEFINKSIPVFLEIITSTKGESFPKGMEYIHLKYKSDLEIFECKGVKWLPSEKWYIYDFEIKKWKGI